VTGCLRSPNGTAKAAAATAAGTPSKPHTPLEQVKDTRRRAIRECVDALRGEAARQADRYYAPIYFGRCADFIERTLLGEGEQDDR
jgi:hypothetical protein